MKTPRLPDSSDRFLAIFGQLFPPGEWPAPELALLLDSLQYRDIEEGTTLLREGQACASLPFVLEGGIRVFKTAESGREITLYRVERGQSCILSTGCGAGILAFPATAVAEKETSAVFMPSATVKRLIAKGPAFRDYILEQYSRRMAEIMELVEEVAFRRVDERLAQWLVEHGAAERADLVVATTHQELADHVGTSREVVSRILKDWEQRKALEISRGSLRLLPGFSQIR